MHKAARRTLWWGIGLFIFGGVALVGLPWLMTGVEASLNFNTVDQTMYFSLIYPWSVIIQYGAFPLGSALIAASVVLGQMDRWLVSQIAIQQPDDTTDRPS